MAFLKKHQSITFLILAGILTIITYGVLIPKLGYYEDDWYLIWSGQTRGISSIIDLFSTDRPFMGYIYAFDYWLLGDNLLAWHLYALFLKLVGVYGLIWLFRMVWPEENFITHSTVLIFIVYPGFLSQPVANTFQNHLLTYHIAILSIATGVAALKAKKTLGKVLLMLLSIGLTAFYQPIYEYMIGLEAVKIVFFWLVIQNDNEQTWQRNLTKTALWYLPYLVISSIFIYWRFFVFESIRRTTDPTSLIDAYKTAPIRSFVYMLIDIGKDILDTVIHAWSIPLYSKFNLANYTDLSESVLWALLATGLTFVYLFFVVKQQEETAATKPKYQKWFIMFGLYIVFITLFPVVFSGREVIYNGFERYTLQTTIGVGLLIAGVLTYVQPKMREFLLLLLVFIGVSTHILNARNWAKDWEKQRELYWQLSWRVPQFDEDTLVIVSNFGIGEDYEAWVPINFIYAPQAEVPYINVELLYSGGISHIIAGAIVGDTLRDVHMEKNYGNVVIATKPFGNSCLYFVDGDLPIISTSAPPLLSSVANYSDLNHIQLSSEEVHQPPTDIFGEELPHNWCFYFQKISLARQAYDWSTIIQLHQEAEKLGYRPNDKSEWMPIVEAYVMSGDTNSAKNGASIIRSDRDLKIGICNKIEENFDNLNSISGYDAEALTQILCKKW